MNYPFRLSITFLTVAASVGFSSAAEPKYSAVKGWLKPASDMQTIGQAHGDVAVSSNSDVYVSGGGARGGLGARKNVADAGFGLRRGDQAKLGPPPEDIIECGSVLAVAQILNFAL